jgi:phage baseplate assembly protein V
MVNSVLSLPEIAVEVAGRRLAADEAGALVGLRVRQRLSLPSLCEVSFLRHAGAGPAPDVQPGASLRIAVDGGDIFEGDVTAVELAFDAAAGRTYRLRGYDRLHRLRKRQPVRAHVQVDLPELARELVGDLGLRVAAEANGPLWPKLIQFERSDFDLLAETAERCGLYFTVRGGTLHLLSLEGIGPDVPLAFEETLLEASLELNAEPVCRSVTAVGWDPARIEAHEGRTSRPRSGRRVDAESPPDRVGGSGERTLAGRVLADDAQAEAAAQAELDWRAAAEVIFRGVAEGDARLSPGARVELRDVEAPFQGRYVLTEVVHTVDEGRGFVSELSSAPPAPTQRSRGADVAPGIVTRVDDPDGFGRVQVELPTHGSLETDWLAVVVPGAGPKKGLVALPAPGDRVLVVLAGGDPAHGVVLGGLYGAERPPDAGVEKNAVRRYTFTTPGGQRLRLDDGRQSIRLQVSGGSYLELRPGRVVLHAAADLDLEAPGRAIRIRGGSIDFERA